MEPRRLRRALSRIATLVWFGVQACADAAVVYVAPSGVDQSPCGLTQQTACGSLGYAVTTISSASLNTIELAGGTYQETGAEIHFSTAGVAIDLTIRAAAGASVTIDRAYRGRLFVFATGTKTVVFDHVRFIRGGWEDTTISTDYSGSFMRFMTSDGTESITFKSCVFEQHRNPARGYSGRGSVAVVAAGSPRFEDCRFNDNWGGVAGTMYIHGDASPVFERCTFENSGCLNDGWGGVVVPEGQSAPVWRHCVFRNNTCDYGGAVDDGGTASPRFEGCTFENNFGRGLGGAYYGFGGTTTKFIGCEFKSNRVSKGGNGQDFYLSSSVYVTFESCVFDSGPNPVSVADGASGNVKDNSTLVMTKSSVKGYRAAQGVYLVSIDARATFESTVFQDNSCVRGGVIFAERPITIKSCTFLRNTATEGGVLLLGMRLPIAITIDNTTFKDNVAKNSGGAIKINGPTSVTILSSSFINNTAQGVGGGAIYVNADADLTVITTVFTANTANVGGAIWSEGKLTVDQTSFMKNELFETDNDSQADSCSLAAGTGGAIYAALPSLVSQSSPDGDCSILGQYLNLSHVTFDRNSAGSSGGGAIFVDKGVPTCVNTTHDFCVACTFTNNVGAYGANVATIARALKLKNATSQAFFSWELMTPVDLVVGAVDFLGQELTGSHAPLAVKVALAPRVELPVGATSTVSLTTTPIRTMRSGDALFKALALQMPPTTLNSVDVPLNLTFTSDLTSVGSRLMSLTVSITLLKCENEKGLIRSSDGKCLVEASGDRQKLIAAIVFSVVLGGGMAFGFYWSYKHSSRVLETLHRLVTGVGASIIRLAFELLDVISDVQALVNLFVFDANLSNLVFVRAAYVTLFAISLPPSVAVMKATFENVAFQWRRMHSHSHRLRAVANHGRVASAPLKAPPTVSELEHSEEEAPETGATFSPVTPMTVSQAAAPNSAPRWNIHSVQVHLTHQIVVLQQDLEHHQARSKYMQRVLVRLLTEDILLFVFNLYIYWHNQSDSVFLQSRFRSSLEFSILMSAMHFGAQVQNVVLWLTMNKVGETKRQIQILENLRAK